MKEDRRVNSFRKDVSSIDLRPYRLRSALFERLDDPAPVLTRDGLPDLHWLLLGSDYSERSFLDAFKATASTALPRGHGKKLVGLERLVWEAKAWTFEPYYLGWAEQSRELRLPARANLETLLRTLARWAATHPLSQLGNEPPHPVPEIVERIAQGTTNPMDAKALIMQCVSDVIRHPDPQSLPGERLNAARSQLAMLRFAEPLAAEGRIVMAAIGRFMRLALAADVDPQPQVLETLKYATRKLQEMNTAGKHDE